MRDDNIKLFEVLDNVDGGIAMHRLSPPDVSLRHAKVCKFVEELIKGPLGFATIKPSI